MNELDIGEVAQRSGLSPATLRYYEEQGLIAAIGRRGLRRQFDDRVLERLALIALGRAAGFSLAEIGGMFSRDGRINIERAQLAVKAEEIDRRIARLTAMRNGLRHAAVCPAPSHLECPTFRRILRVAAAGALPADPPPSRRAPKACASKTASRPAARSRNA